MQYKMNYLEYRFLIGGERMALIKCPKCGKEISDKATNCVGCGWKVEPIKDSTKKQTTKLQHMVAIKKEKRFSDANIFFMIALAFVMICFVVIVWRRLDEFEKEIDILISNNQINSTVITNGIENESVENLEKNENQEDLAHNKEEISDKNMQNENLTEENGRQEDTPENIASSEEDVVNADNSDLKFEYTSNKVSDAYVTVYFKITNEGDAPIYLTMQQFHFLNDVSIEQAFSKLDDEILSGKSSLLEICFNREKIEAAGISTINSFVCQYNVAEDKNGENLTSNEITFNGLGINID